MTELRSYQRDAISAVTAYLHKRTGNPLVVLPTGSGKSMVIAGFVKEMLSKYPDATMLVVSHRRELVEQDAQAIAKLVGIRVGLCIAGEKSFRQVTAGTVQSLRRANMPAFDILIVDEAHRIPHDGEGEYHSVIDTLKSLDPTLRIVGMTATDYRLDGGRLTEGERRVFHSVVYEKPVGELVEAGYLSPLTSPEVAAVDVSSVGIKMGDYNEKELSVVMESKRVVKNALDDFDKLAHDRKSCIFFCVTVAHAEIVLQALRERGHTAEMVTGETDPGQRKSLLARFKDRRFRCLVSVELFTEGFDAPCVDCLVMLRPTKSTGLYVQMAGRGMRLYPGKTDCLVLDFAGNIAEHGPINNVTVKTKGEKKGEAPTRLCKGCRNEMPIQMRECPECGLVNEIDERIAKHEERAARMRIMEDVRPVTIEVVKCKHSVHPGKGDGKPPTLRVDYYGKRDLIVSEWVCIEHEGFAGDKAVHWWKRMGGGEPMPKTSSEAVQRADELKTVTSVTVVPDGKYKRIKSCTFAPLALAPAPF